MSVDVDPSMRPPAVGYVTALVYDDSPMAHAMREELEADPTEALRALGAIAAVVIRQNARLLEVDVAEVLAALGAAAAAVE